MNEHTDEMEAVINPSENILINLQHNTSKKILIEISNVMELKGLSFFISPLCIDIYKTYGLLFIIPLKI